VTGILQIGLRAGERIYINGAVLRVDRKVRLELLNTATFLLGSHVMQLEEATTPMRQLYFLIQGLLMDPDVEASLRPAIEDAIAVICKAPAGAAVAQDLWQVSGSIANGCMFEALKMMRQLVVQDDKCNIAASGAVVENAEVI